MASKRTRTGCKTCRSRKLKCDEERPICGQCRKSSRTCIPSEGITFRHAQNAGMNSDGGDLDSFFKYRQTFNNRQYFVPIPKELKFVQVTDPWEDDSIPQAPADYQQVAAHSLEALSTAAAGDPSTVSRSDPYDEYSNVYAQNPARRPNSSHLRGDQNNDINFLLNPASHTPSALIDPNLEASSDNQPGQSIPDSMKGQDIEQIVEEDGNPKEHAKDDGNHFDQQVLAALQNTA